MQTTKEKRQEAELIFTTYLGLPEKERTMVLAYTTALRDKTLAEEQARQQPVKQYKAGSGKRQGRSGKEPAVM